MNFDELREVVAETLEVDSCELTESAELVTLTKIDSIKILTLLVALDDLGISISQNQAADLKTYGDILALSKAA